LGGFTSKRWKSEISIIGRVEQRYNNDNPAIVNPYALFLYALNSPVTRNDILKTARYFLAKISLVDDNTEKTIEKLCTIFVENGKQDPEGSHSHSAQNKTRSV
jgi:hypothetical protein